MDLDAETEPYPFSGSDNDDDDDEDENPDPVSKYGLSAFMITSDVDVYKGRPYRYVITEPPEELLKFDPDPFTIHQFKIKKTVQQDPFDPRERIETRSLIDTGGSFTPYTAQQFYPFTAFVLMWLYTPDGIGMIPESTGFIIEKKCHASIDYYAKLVRIVLGKCRNKYLVALSNKSSYNDTEVTKWAQRLEIVYKKLAIIRAIYNWWRDHRADSNSVLEKYPWLNGILNNWENFGEIGAGKLEALFVQDFVLKAQSEFNIFNSRFRFSTQITRNLDSEMDSEMILYSENTGIFLNNGRESESDSITTILQPSSIDTRRNNNNNNNNNNMTE
jgi:hypothetical protein